MLEYCIVFNEGWIFMFNIVLYFGLLGFGWWLSAKGYIVEKLMSKISHVQTFFLFSLIFIMGIRLGMDKQVVSSIGQIGFKAATFAFLTALFSVIFVFIGRKKLIVDKNITGEK